jgi:hypothetical protein
MYSLTTFTVSAAAIAALALTGCSQAGLSAADAYKVGCPALDSVAASGSAVGKVALTGLEKLRDSGQLSGETKQWVDGAIQFLQNPDKADPAQQQQIKDGCAANGYPLKNFG